MSKPSRVDHGSPFSVNDTVVVVDPEQLIANPMIDGVFRTIHQKHLLVLAYHGVEDEARFRSHLEWLVTVRNPISVDMLGRSLAQEEPLPPRPFLVTFDDGRRSVLTKGLPVLRRMGVPAALFVIAGLVGTDAPYWWAEAEELSKRGGRTAVSNLVGIDLVRHLKTVPNPQRERALRELRETSPCSARPYPHLTVEELQHLDASGVHIGSHSLTHPMLDQCDEGMMNVELKESRRMLEEWLDRDVTALAYPNGNVDRLVIRAARSSGHELGFLFDHRLQSQPIYAPLRISRVRIDATASLARLKVIANGFLPTVHRIRRRA